MYEAGKSFQIAKEMNRYKLHILGISETHWTQSGRKYLQSGELLLFSGRKDSKHSEGVGLMISKQVQKALRGWQPHGERIIEASFTTKNRNINLNIIQIYSPTNEAPNEEKKVL